MNTNLAYLRARSARVYLEWEHTRVQAEVFVALDPMKGMITSYLSSPQGRKMVQDYLASAEGKKAISEYIGTPQGKATVHELLPSILDTLPLSPDHRALIMNSLNNQN